MTVAHNVEELRSLLEADLPEGEAVLAGEDVWNEHFQSLPHIAKSDFEKMFPAHQKLIYADNNKWEYDYGTERWINLHHKDNDEMLQQRQVVETRAFLGR